MIFDIIMEICYYKNNKKHKGKVMQTFKWKDAIKLLKTNDFIKKTGKGSHNRYVHENFDWLNVTVDEGHDISANVYIEIIRMVALKKYIFEETFDEADTRQDFMLRDISEKIKKSNVLELFNIEHSKMNLRDEFGLPYKIDSTENALKFIRREKQKLNNLNKNGGRESGK